MIESNNSTTLILRKNPITTSRFKLTLLEKFIFSQIISFIDPKNPSSVSVPLEKLDELADLFLMEKITPQRLLNIVKSLMKKVYETADHNTLIAIIDHAVINEEKQTFEVVFTQKGAPLLKELKEKLSPSELNTTLSLSKIYSKKMYEVLSGYATNYETTITISMKALKKRMGVINIENYTSWAGFRKNILEVAQEDLRGQDISFQFSLQDECNILFHITNSLLIPGKENATEQLAINFGVQKKGIQILGLT